jgi:hypothetical protein
MTELLVTLPEPHINQQKILSEAKRFNTVCCGRRWGKSVLAVNLLSEPALEGWPTGYFTPTYKLLEGTYKACVLALEHVIKKKHENQFIELITGGNIDFWSLDNPYAGRSKKYKRAITDEGAFAKNLWEIWTQSIRPTLTDLEGDAWHFSTPTGKNDFHKLFMKGKGGDNNWMSFQQTTYDNPYINPSEIDEARKDLPTIAFSQEYMAEFNDNIANPFGIAFINQCTYPLSTEPAVCYGIDLAKSFDYTVIIGLDKNGAVCYFDRFQKDWRSTVNTILALPNIPICIDSTGVGDPIGEDIARVRDVELFKFTSKSKQQLMEGLAAQIQKRLITFPEGVIVDELSNFEYEYTKSGVRYTAPQGLHDDCVCALALAVSKYRDAGSNGQYSFA